ncbi:MAG: family 20 glycosylhydrolase, partial [Bacteroidaceae bacterium]|nr:family 20 glycosylhydrolase [Bacteroidaceae bacterium]
LEEAYSLNPAGSLGGREEYCLGVQCNLWAETLNDNTELEYQLLPRMIAVAETGWLPSSKKEWGGFYRRLQSHDEILDLLGYTYAKHYIEPKEYSDVEKAIMEAEELLENSTTGVGYPEAEYRDRLSTALHNIEGDDVTELVAAIEAFKSAPIKQPEEGKTYQLVSASTYYKRQYEGSTMYQSSNGVRFHYTPQVEPEELWQFEAADGGYIMKNLYSGKAITLGGYNTVVTTGDNGTPVRIDKATIASRDVTFVPGAVTISAVDGYDAAMTGSVKRLSAELSGDVYAKDEAALCYNGTWKFVEVTDFTEQLAGLVNKCRITIYTAKPGKVGQPTEEALDFLQKEIIEPANKIFEAGAATEEQYNAFVVLYHQFMMMPRTTLAETIDTGVYYYIRNAYFTDKYAAYSNNRVEPKAKGTADNFLWSFVKNSDGTVYIYNKANGKAAYIGSDAIDQTIKVGNEYAWTLKETTTDTGSKGIAIVAGDGEHGWYTNPNAWGYLLTKPYTWGASVWTLEKSAVEVETGIEDIRDNVELKGIFDLQGRKIEHPAKGIYIIDGNKVLVK